MIAKGIPDEGYEYKKDIGAAMTIRLDRAPVGAIIPDGAAQFYEPEQYTRCGIVSKGHDVVVVKQGYIPTEFAAYGGLCMMALTQRPAYQRSELLKFKQIYRPMWSYDDYDLEDMLQQGIMGFILGESEEWRRAWKREVIRYIEVYFM